MAIYSRLVLFYTASCYQDKIVIDGMQPNLFNKIGKIGTRWKVSQSQTSFLEQLCNRSLFQVVREYTQLKWCIHDGGNWRKYIFQALLLQWRGKRTWLASLDGSFFFLMVCLISSNDTESNHASDCLSVLVLNHSFFELAVHNNISEPVYIVNIEYLDERSQVYISLQKTCKWMGVKY